MSQVPPFVISEFTKPSEEIVFPLTGWLDVKRIRKTFRPAPETSAERQSLVLPPSSVLPSSVPSSVPSSDLPSVSV